MTGLEKIGNVLDFLQIFNVQGLCLTCWPVTKKVINYKHNIFETSGKLGFRDGV